MGHAFSSSTPFLNGDKAEDKGVTLRRACNGGILQKSGVARFLGLFPQPEPAAPGPVERYYAPPARVARSLRRRGRGKVEDGGVQLYAPLHKQELPRTSLSTHFGE